MEGFCTSSKVLRRIRYHTRWFTWFAYAVSTLVTGHRKSVGSTQSLRVTTKGQTRILPLHSTLKWH